MGYLRADRGCDGPRVLRASANSYLALAPGGEERRRAMIVKKALKRLAREETMWKLLSAAFAIAGAIGGGPAPPGAPTPANITHPPSPYFGPPHYIPAEDGWWKDVGLTPGFSVFPAGAPQVAAAQAKSWDVGGTGSVPAVLGAARSGLLTIGITNDESKANVLMVRGEKFDAFKANPQSLKGQRILLTTNSTGDYSVRNCLRKYVALWDLAARRAGKPLWAVLGGGTARIAVYASGINPDRPEMTVGAMRDRGHRAFKLKVGFGDELDCRNLCVVREAFGDDILLAADANQAWDLERATALSHRFESYGLHWLEEPLRADRPWSEWKTLSRSTILPLAAGENVAGIEAFAEALAQGGLKVVQPDAAKWGGVSGCHALARMIADAGCTYCPHYLGGGVGLLASAHLLAAAGGNGLLELDVNDNPLRDEVCGSLREIRDGHATLADAPGLGAEPDLDRLRRFQVRAQSISANLSGWRKLLDRFRFRRAKDRYEPSNYYMRGPGPKARSTPARTP